MSFPWKRESSFLLLLFIPPGFNLPSMKVPFILASASPRRRRLMASFPFKTRVRPSGAAEPARRQGEEPSAYAKRLARLKAAAVARRHPGALVLGADTIVVFRGKIFGKPRHASEAARMLAALSGRWHRVHTGLALFYGKRVWTGSWTTMVQMRALDGREIRRHSRRHLDKAGAYAAQARGNPFVARSIGDYDNVVGLPRRGLRILLRRAAGAGVRPA